MAIRLALRVAYDGTSFRGFAPNPGVATIGGELRRALAQVMPDEPTITCAGRTDAGVHARSQIITIDVETLRVPPEKLRYSLNGLTPDSITVADLWCVEPTFDARHSATGRTYRYTIENRRAPDPMLRHQVWHVPRPLDLDAMIAASPRFVGTHDFSSFCRRKFITTLEGDEIQATRVRTVRSLDWQVDAEDPALWRCWITASSFCQQMVRSIVGTLSDVGSGDVTTDDIDHMFTVADRNEAGAVAPPTGLVLWSVEYADHPSPTGRPGELTST